MNPCFSFRLMPYLSFSFCKQVSFEETIGEPDSTHSIDCLWKYSYKCFSMWKSLCYIIATTFCGIPHAICWGCTFACIAFIHIWEITPYLRCMEIQLDIYKKCSVMYYAAFLEPYCNACGAFFNVWRK